MLKISYADLVKITLKLCVAGRNREKFTKISSFEGSRAFKVIDVDKSKKPSPVLILMCNMSVPICNCFHSRRANSGKITFLGGTPFDALRTFSLRSARSTKFRHEKLESLWAAHSKNFVILACVVLT